MRTRRVLRLSKQPKRVSTVKRRKLVFRPYLKYNLAIRALRKYGYDWHLDRKNRYEPLEYAVKAYGKDVVIGYLEKLKKYNKKNSELVEVFERDISTVKDM